jgi:glutamate dehydrogenase
LFFDISLTMSSSSNAAEETAKPVNGVTVLDKFSPSSPLPSGAGTPSAPVNKHLDAVIRTPGRQPSPQPTHLGIPGGTHRVLSEEGPGYVAAKFEGKDKQMEAGKSFSP